MTNNDFNYIEPVESLHSVHSLTPAQQREEQKRRQRPRQQAQPPQQQPPAEQRPEEKPLEDAPNRRDDPHRIDYCA